jgi:prolyl-tRNA synthetase
MRMSRLLLQTLREPPGEARTPGYQRLVRGGFLRAGPVGFAFLPLGTAVRQQVQEAALQLLRARDGQRVSLAMVRPAGASPDSLEVHPVRFRDRAQREMVCGGGRETAVVALAIGLIRSYRQLPILLYEVRQSFRDEEPLVGGLLGTREGLLVDAYGLCRDAEELFRQYEAVRGALTGLLASWDLGAHDVICAEDGEGRPAGHAAVYPVADGDQTYARCPACGYAADTAVARVGQASPASEELLPMQDVETPECKTIAELASFLDIPTSRTAKAVFLVASRPGESDRFVFAVVRGDTALNEDRLKAVLGAESVGPATEAEIRQAGAEPGYGSPVGLSGVTVVVDTLAASSPNLVAGANRPGYHTLNVNLGRDYRASLVADIATAQEGSPCPACGSPVSIEHGVPLAETRQAGDGLSRDLNATYQDNAGANLPFALGRYMLHIDRVIAALAERHHDAHGLVWPASAAPYQVHLMTIGKSGAEVNAVAERIYAELTGAGIAVLFDDRDERAGVKFNDADLLGAPWRVAIGDRGLQSGAVEVKRRNQADAQLVALDQVVSYLAD